MKKPDKETIISWGNFARIRGTRYSDELSPSQKSFSDDLCRVIEKYLTDKKESHSDAHNMDIEYLYEVTNSALNDSENEAPINEIIGILEQMKPSAREQISEGVNPDQVVKLTTGELALIKPLGEGDDPVPTSGQLQDPKTRLKALERLSGICTSQIKIKTGRNRPKGKKSKDTIAIDLVGLKLGRGRPKDIDELFFTGGIKEVYEKFSEKKAFRRHRSSPSPADNDGKCGPFVDLTAAIWCWIYEEKLLSPPQKWGFYNLNVDDKMDRCTKAADSMIKNLVEAIKAAEENDEQGFLNDDLDAMLEKGPYGLLK